MLLRKLGCQTQGVLDLLLHIKYMNILKITPNTLYKEFITDSQTKKNIELTEKICSLSEEKKVFITSVIDLLNDM